MDQKLELHYKGKIDSLTAKRDIELNKLSHMIKNNSDRLKIEDQFKTLMREQNELSLTIGSHRVYVESK